MRNSYAAGMPEQSSAIESPIESALEQMNDNSRDREPPSLNERKPFGWRMSTINLKTEDGSVWVF